MSQISILIMTLVLTACANEGPYYLGGSAELPACDLPPDATLAGTAWYDSGTVTVDSDGCEGAQSGDQFDTCGLNWAFSASDGDLEILVDNEYRIKARLCGDELYLRGGWWLPVADEGACTYDEDSADEVRILEGGNVLTVAANAMSGTLRVRGRCEARYDITLTAAITR